MASPVFPYFGAEVPYVILLTEDRFIYFLKRFGLDTEILHLCVNSRSDKVAAASYAEIIRHLCFFV